jgi:hypothetical protein
LKNGSSGTWRDERAAGATAGVTRGEEAMEVDEFWAARRFADLAPGTAFRFGLRRVIYVGLKTVDADGELGCAVLAPGHPDFGAKPGMSDASKVNQYPVLAMPALRFVLSRDPKQWTIGQATNLEIGTVLVMPGRTLLCTGSSKGQVVKVDVRSGEIVQDKMIDVPIIVRRWSLVDPVGGSQPVFEFTG